MSYSKLGFSSGDKLERIYSGFYYKFEINFVKLNTSFDKIKALDTEHFYTDNILSTDSK